MYRTFSLSLSSISIPISNINMDFISLLNTLKRRWLIMLIPAVVVFIFFLITSDQPVVPPPTYNVGVRFLVGPPEADPPPTSDLPAADLSDAEAQYYRWLTSEYLVNGLADWINGIGFAELVAAKLTERGIEVDPLALFGQINADTIRSRLTVTINHGDEATLQEIMAVAIEVITQENNVGIPHLVGDELVDVTLLDRPVINAIPAPIGNQLDLPIRIIVALVIGLLIGLLAEYFDPRVRAAPELDRMGVQLLNQNAINDMRTLRGNLLLSAPDAQVVVMTAVDDMATVNSAAVGLARALAQAGRSTILVDADLGLPILHTQLGLSNQAGLAEVLRGEEKLRLQATDLTQLKLLSAGAAGAEAADLISGPKLDQVVAQLRDLSDIVIFKTAAANRTMDGSLLAALGDITLLAVAQGKTKRQTVAQAQRDFKMAGKPFFVVLLGGYQTLLVL